MIINPQDLKLSLQDPPPLREREKEKERKRENMSKSSKRIWRLLPIIARSHDSWTILSILSRNIDLFHRYQIDYHIIEFENIQNICCSYILKLKPNFKKCTVKTA